MKTRGQATLELALGSLVFVGVLLAGIHLAEYAQLSLKVQEAQTFAVWEAAGRRVQSRALGGGTDTQPFRRTLDDVSGVAPRAQRRYADFNGISGTDNGNVIGRALTQGRGVQVQCEVERSLRFSPSNTARGVMLEAGGLACRSSAEVRAINVPRRFLQRSEGGFFEETIVRRDPIPVCGMGLPVNGRCDRAGVLAILTNDWGLANDETAECKLDCDASPYRGMVRSMFGSGGGGAGAAFAAQFAGGAPVTAGDYFFSYSGVESGMTDFVGGEGDPVFITGGAGTGMVPRMSHPKCFLGKACP